MALLAEELLLVVDLKVVGGLVGLEAERLGLHVDQEELDALDVLTEVERELAVLSGRVRVGVVGRVNEAVEGVG